MSDLGLTLTMPFDRHSEEETLSLEQLVLDRLLSLSRADENLHETKRQLLEQRGELELLRLRVTNAEAKLEASNRNHADTIHRNNAAEGPLRELWLAADAILQSSKKRASDPLIARLKSALASAHDHVDLLPF